MGDFAQNGMVATLHDFGTRTTEQLEHELRVFSGYRPMELILPTSIPSWKAMRLPILLRKSARLTIWDM